MEMKHIYLTASYLLENEIQELNEVAAKQIVDSIRNAIPQDLTNAITQTKNDGEILSILKGYTKDKIGREAKSIDDAIKLINQNPQQEITSITNMPIKAEQTTEPFPGKRDLFIASYKKTLQLGWPGEEIKVKGAKQEIGPDGKPIKNVAAESPVSGKLIPLNVGAKTGTKLTEFNPAKIVNKNWIKLAETLVFNKFKNNPNGLRKLSQAVDDIIEKNKNYKL